jgi:hypothetical protein
MIRGPLSTIRHERFATARRQVQAMAIAIGSLVAYARQGRWMRRIGVVVLVAALFLTSRSPCTVQIPGGQVTYSRPGE